MFTAITSTRPWPPPSPTPTPTAPPNRREIRAPNGRPADRCRRRAIVAAVVVAAAPARRIVGAAAEEEAVETETVTVNGVATTIVERAARARDDRAHVIVRWRRVAKALDAIAVYRRCCVLAAALGAAAAAAAINAVPSGAYRRDAIAAAAVASAAAR